MQSPCPRVPPILAPHTGDTCQYAECRPLGHTKTSNSLPFDSLSRQRSSHIGCDHPMARTRLASAHHHDNDVLALPQVSVPSRKKPGAAKPNALPDLIRVGQGFCDSMSMLWQQIGMSLGNVTRMLAVRSTSPADIGARKPAHDDSPFSLRSLTGQVQWRSSPHRLQRWVGRQTHHSPASDSEPPSLRQLRTIALRGILRAAGPSLCRDRLNLPVKAGICRTTVSKPLSCVRLVSRTSINV